MLALKKWVTRSRNKDISTLLKQKLQKRTMQDCTKLPHRSRRIYQVAPPQTNLHKTRVYAKVVASGAHGVVAVFLTRSALGALGLATFEVMLLAEVLLKARELVHNVDLEQAHAVQHTHGDLADRGDQESHEAEKNHEDDATG